MSIDLHVHSTHSDGSYTPEEIIEQAIARGLTALSICDHDATSANEPARRAAAGRLTYIPGVEVTVMVQETEIHLLGYFVRDDYPPLEEELAKIRRERIARIERIVTRLRSLGLNVRIEDVLEAAGVGERVGAHVSIGRPHVAAALVKRGVVATPQEAFERYLRRGRPGYVERYRLAFSQAIALIREAGGLPVLAHPGLVGNDTLIERLIPLGIAGLEAYHTAHPPADIVRYRAMAQRWGLLITGGTDSHGPTGSYPVEIGALAIPDECAAQLLEWAATRR